jgi:hypothetical protein
VTTRGGGDFSPDSQLPAYGKPYSDEIRDRFFEWCGKHRDYADETRLEADIERWEELGENREGGVGAVRR